MRIKSFWIATILVALAPIVTTACRGKDYNITNVVNLPTGPSSSSTDSTFSISGPTNFTLVLGPSTTTCIASPPYQIPYLTSPAGLPVVWTSSNTGDVRVDSNAIATATGVGVAVITGALKTKPSVTASVFVTVVACAPVTTSSGIVVLIPSVKYTLHNGPLCGVQRYQVLAEVLPVGTSQAVRWSLSKSGVINIDTNGVVSATVPQSSSGTAVVTATSRADTTVSASMTVVEDLQACGTTVSAVTPMQKDSTQQPVGQTIGVADPTLDWWSTNPSILNVNSQNGSTTAEYPGTAQVCAKPRNNPANIPQGCSLPITVSP
jgi:hypothetical protein